MMSKMLGARDENDEGGNVIPITKALDLPMHEPQFSANERRELRKMMRQFANLRMGCPTARRECGD